MINYNNTYYTAVNTLLLSVSFKPTYIDFTVQISIAELCRLNADCRIMPSKNADCRFFAPKKSWPASRVSTRLYKFFKKISI